MFNFMTCGVTSIFKFNSDQGMIAEDDDESIDWEKEIDSDDDNDDPDINIIERWHLKEILWKNHMATNKKGKNA